MSLSAEVFFSYMEKQKIERSEEIETLREALSLGIKTEVTAAIKPLEDKQQQLEEAQKLAAAEQLSIKHQLSSIQLNLADLTKQPIPDHPHPNPRIHEAGNDSSSENHDSEASRIIREATKILGFSPINKDDIEYLKSNHLLVNDQDAYYVAIKEFLELEMNVPESILANLRIKKVFPPSQQSDFGRLYAEFSDNQSANLIFSYVKNLKQGTNVSMWIPPQFYQRFRALDEVAFKLRRSSENWRTKIKFGTSDLLLMKKPRIGGTWSSVDVTDLPPIDLQVQPILSLNASPPRGRHRKRTRVESSDDDLDMMQAKSLKTIPSPKPVQNVSLVNIDNEIIPTAQNSDPKCAQPSGTSLPKPTPPSEASLPKSTPPPDTSLPKPA